MVVSAHQAQPVSTKDEIQRAVHAHFAMLNARKMPSERRLDTRYYQIEAWEASLSALDRGVRRQMLVMPTGTGKTVTFATLTWLLGQRLGRIPRTLVLAHRFELIDQALAAFAQVYPAATRAKIAGSDCAYDADITAAMVPTLGRDDKDHPDGYGWKLRRYIRRTPDLVIVDESHHSPASTYLRVLRATFGDHTLRLGVTATPNRSDGLALLDIYDEIVYKYELEQAISDTFLVKPRGVRHRLNRVNLDKVKANSNTGDFSESSLAKLFDTPDGRAETVATWEKHAVQPGGNPLKTIVFACTGEHAKHLAAEFDRKGYRSAFIGEETASDERKAIYRQFSAGEIQVLVSVMVLTEGFDEPSIECVLMVRPTQSWSLFVQMVGRGLRLFPGKTSCLILDISGNTKRFSLVGLNMLGGFVMEEEALEDDQPAGNSSESGENLLGSTDEDEGDLEPLRLAIEVGAGMSVDLVRLRKQGRFAWEETQYGFGLLLGAVDSGGIFLIRKHDPERDKLPVKYEYFYKIVHLQQVLNNWRAEVLAQKLTLAEAQALCEQEAPRLGGKRVVGASSESVAQAITALATRNREVNARLSKPMRDAAVTATPDQRRRLRQEVGLGAAADDLRVVKGEAMKIIGWAAQVGETKARLGVSALRSAWGLSDADVAALIDHGDLVRMVTRGWQNGFTQIVKPSYLQEAS